MLKHLYNPIFWKREFIRLKIFVHEIFQRNDMVPKIFNSTDQLSSTI